MYLSSRVKNILENALGKSILELSQMDMDEERDFVLSKTGKIPIFSKEADSRIVGRGNPLIARRRLCTMEDIDKRIMGLIDETGNCHTVRKGQKSATKG